MNLPSYNFLPAPLWLITVLHVVTLTLHFLAMNFLLGGLIILLFARLKNKWEVPAVQTYIKLLPTAVAATVTLGVAPLLFLQLVYYQQAYSASIVNGWFWILIISAVIVAYYLLYGSALKSGSSRVSVPRLLAVALPLLVYVSLVYSTVFSMAERPEWYHALYATNQSGWAVNTDAGAWLFRWLHMVAGAVAVGGFFVGVLGRKHGALHGVGRMFFVWGTVTAMVVGIAYLFSLGEYLLPVMRSPVIWLITASFVLALGALHQFFTAKTVRAAVLLFLTMIAMVTARHLLRLIVLDGKFDPAAIPVNPQWSVFAVFLVCFLVALALVAYMLKLYFRGRGEVAA